MNDYVSVLKSDKTKSWNLKFIFYLCKVAKVPNEFKKILSMIVKASIVNKFVPHLKNMISFFFLISRHRHCWFLCCDRYWLPLYFMKLLKQTDVSLCKTYCKCIFEFKINFNEPSVELLTYVINWDFKYCVNIRFTDKKASL